MLAWGGRLFGTLILSNLGLSGKIFQACWALMGTAVEGRWAVGKPLEILFPSAYAPIKSSVACPSQRPL